MVRKLLSTLVALAAVAAAPSQAAVLVYYDEASYLAAVGSTRTYIDFFGSPGATVSGGSFSPDVTFGSCSNSAAASSCGTQVLHNSNAITDLGGSTAPNGVASLAWRFDIPDVFAFALNYISGQIDFINLVATDNSLTAINTVAANGFIGLVSDTAFYGAIGVNAVFPGGGNDRYFIDDFRINQRTGGNVPEPTTWALLGVALCAALRPRRRTAAASSAAR